MCGGEIAWWRGGLGQVGWLLGFSVPSAISKRFLLPPSTFSLSRLFFMVLLLFVESYLCARGRNICVSCGWTWFVCVSVGLVRARESLRERVSVVCCKHTPTFSARRLSWSARWSRSWSMAVPAPPRLGSVVVWCDGSSLPVGCMDRVHVVGSVTRSVKLYN